MLCKTLVPKGQGGMVAVLGSTVEIIEKILKDNEQNFNVQIANDNSDRSNCIKWQE